MREGDEAPTDGHPLHCFLSFSAMMPTAASLASIDLTTDSTSLPGVSDGPTSVLTSFKVCLKRSQTFLKCDHVREKHQYAQLSLHLYSYLDLTLAPVDL